MPFANSSHWTGELRHSCDKSRRTNVTGGDDTFPWTRRTLAAMMARQRGLVLGGCLGIASMGVLTPSSARAVAPPTPPPAPLNVFNPACVVAIQPGDSLGLIADNIPDPAVNVTSLQIENGISDADVIHDGAYLDVCVGNTVNDITGETRLPPESLPSSVPADATGVEAQQQKLNQLFAGYGIAELAVDGDSGPLTRQQLCAARLALNLPVSTADMVPGSDEERFLMAATSVAIPSTAIVAADKWVLIDQTCQVMFVGESSTRIAFVFATSTGQPDYPTRNQERVRVFRYDPAIENAGWHDSTRFPASEDNPLNGNMYLPLYFHNGQAIHGANNVPPQPESHGCARLHVEDQDALIAWLGLTDATGPVWNRDRINLSVTVQGEFLETTPTED